MRQVQLFPNAEMELAFIFGIGFGLVPGSQADITATTKFIVNDPTRERGG